MECANEVSVVTACLFGYANFLSSVDSSCGRGLNWQTNCEMSRRGTLFVCCHIVLLISHVLWWTNIHRARTAVSRGSSVLILSIQWFGESAAQASINAAQLCLLIEIWKGYFNIYLHFSSNFEMERRTIIDIKNGVGVSAARDSVPIVRMVIYPTVKCGFDHKLSGQPIAPDTRTDCVSRRNNYRHCIIKYML